VKNLLFPRVVPLPKTESLAVLVSHDRLRAYLFCLPCAFPPRFSARTIAQWLHQAGIRAVLDFQAIQEFAKKTAQGEKPGAVLVASGTEPDCGPEGGWVFKIRSPAAERRPGAPPNYFQRGEKICEHLGPGTGKPGTDVWGHPVEPPPALPPAVGEGIETRPNALVAARDGFLVQSGERCVLAPECRLSGSILPFYSPLEIPGSVTIVGDIPPKVSLESSRNVVVEGNVEKGAKIRAAGSLCVRGRVSHAFLGAGDTIRCDTALRSTLEAGGDIEIVSTLGDRSRAATRGVFRGHDGSVVENATVEALKGADLWVCKGKNLEKCTISVGLTQVVERRISAIEQEIRRLAGQREKVFERFSLKYDSVLRDPRKRARLSPRERERFEKERAEAMARQEQLDAEISSLKGKQHQLAKQRESSSSAYVRVRSNARPPFQFWIRKRSFTKATPLQGPFVVQEGPDHRIHVNLVTERTGTV